jgi:putative membrane-bound dehydrogenase-like protein
MRTAFLCFLCFASSVAQEPSKVAGSERARKALESFPSRGARTDTSIQPRSPAETVASFQLMDGFVADAVLNEPLVRQPVFLTFDERGRMWVVQFLQYPYPAGLRIVDVDDQFHAVYDRVPPAPPNHVRGADRITIHEDTDGDGAFDRHKTFLDGLNMVTAVQPGRGGVFVLHPPYLLFYPDADRDDFPDGDPIVHLSGFGLEDTHSAANSLTWGPDGWLYGGQGSGVSSTIVRPGIDQSDKGVYFKGQVIWRYHPERREFELFSEGGGNTFGVEFDAAGRVYSGINGSDVRGFHFVQGGYYQKNFGEHGYLTNPYAFGYFPAMKHATPIPRFSHTFVIYEDGALGEALDGRMVAVNPLQHRLMVTGLLAHGSTFETRDEGMLLESDDRWFRPVDIKVGPDGAIYVADWYDTRLTHMDPRDNWDRKHGRIFRISQERRDFKQEDLATLDSSALVALLDDPRKWHRQQALRQLGDRRDRSVIPLLKAKLREPSNPRALDALWALHQVGGFTPEMAITLLSHEEKLVRLWTVRLSGDRASALGEELARAAEVEPIPQVRSQLAATARRLPADQALPVILALCKHDEDRDDPHIPLMLWWALEAHMDEVAEAFLGALQDGSLWKRPLMSDHLLSRFARRLAVEMTVKNQMRLAQLLAAAPGPASRQVVLNGINEAFRGREMSGLVASLEQLLGNDAPVKAKSMAAAQLAIGLRSGRPGLMPHFLSRILDDTPEAQEERLALIPVVGELKKTEAIPALLQVLSRSKHPRARSAALQCLGEFEDPEMPSEVLALWASLTNPLREQVLNVLSSRKEWAKQLLVAVGGSGTISKADVSDLAVMRLRLLDDPEVDALIDRFFGKAVGITSDAKAQRIREVAAVLRNGTGDAASGTVLFAKRCAACHQLFGKGGALGPDLTAVERTNTANMLLQIVDPNAGIREGYTLFQIVVKDGRQLLGYIEESDGKNVSLRDAAGQLTTLAEEDVAGKQALPMSLMPEGLLDDLNEQQLRDLFAYLESVESRKPLVQRGGSKW